MAAIQLNGLVKQFFLWPQFLLGDAPRWRRTSQEIIEDCVDMFLVHYAGCQPLEGCGISAGSWVALLRSSRAHDPLKRASDGFFGAALQAVTVRDDEVVEIPAENRLEAAP